MSIGANLRDLDAANHLTRQTSWTSTYLKKRVAAQVARIACTLAAICALVFLWRQNYDKLGNFYDYSLFASGNAFLRRGLLPYRDFGTVLQSMTYWLAYGCELAFGPNYLSLAYGNLILTLLLFGAAFALARRAASHGEALLVALAVCAASTLQHGIIWYNTLGILWLCLVTLIGFRAIKKGRLPYRDLVCLAALLCCTGLTKLNSHAAAFAITFFCLAALYVKRSYTGKRLASYAFVLLISGTALPLLIELLTTGATLSQWLHNVIVLPSQRAQNLRLLLHRPFWFGTVYPWYKGAPFVAVFAIGALIFVTVTVRIALEDLQPWPRKLRPLQLFSLLGIWLFYALAAVIAVSNVDLPSIPITLLPLGLLAAAFGFSHQLSSSSQRRLRTGASVMALSLLILSCIGIARHCRLTYGDDPASPSFVYRVPDGYLKGVSVTEADREKLLQAASLLSEFGIEPGSDEVYWGPGLEIFSRQFATQQLPGVPLWFHPMLSPESSAGNLIARLQSSRVRLMIEDPNWNPGAPPSFKLFLTTHWRPATAGPLNYYVRPNARR